MKVISFNANGIRAAARKGFFEWLQQQNADVVCIQETKARLEQLEDAVFHPQGYHCYYFDASSKKGYSGVALYCKQEPKQIHNGLGFALADEEGRYIQADFDKVSVASLYLPSGTSGDHRQELKYHFLAEFEKKLTEFNAREQAVVLCGDWNIAHKQIDIKNWRGNQKNSGFLPEERAWLDKIFDDMHYVDAFREVDQQADRYTWWSMRGNARANNVGWRIDYQIVSNPLRGKAKRAAIYIDENFSDHAPLIMEYNLD